jgi:hypothetical protein
MAAPKVLDIRLLRLSKAYFQPRRYDRKSWGQFTTTVIPRASDNAASPTLSQPARSTILPYRTDAISGGPTTRCGCAPRSTGPAPPPVYRTR